MKRLKIFLIASRLSLVHLRQIQVVNIGIFLHRLDEKRQ